MIGTDAATGLDGGRGLTREVPVGHRLRVTGPRGAAGRGDRRLLGGCAELGEHSMLGSCLAMSKSGVNLTAFGRVAVIIDRKAGSCFWV